MRQINWLKRHAAFIIVIAVALAAAAPLFIDSGLLATRAGGDSPFLLQRVQQMAENLRQGVLPARWMPDGALGYGYPFYDFYAPLPFYLAGLLSLAGYGTVLAIKLTQAVAMLLGAIGTWLLLRELEVRPWGAALSAILFTLAPFHLVNLYVRGDALGEFFAMGYFPWVLWSLLRLRSRASATNLILAGTSYSLLVLSHNVSAMLFTPLVLLVLVICAFEGGWSPNYRFLVRGLGALALGLALSAWFWLPAIHEQSLVQLQEQTTGYFSYAGHFRLFDLVQIELPFNYSIDAQRNPFQMSAWQVLAALAGLAVIVADVLRRRRLCAWQLAFAAGALGTTYLITPYSAWIWEHIPLLQLAQFPWRLLSLQALCIAVLAVPAVNWLPERAARVTVPILALSLSLYALAGLRPTFLPLGEGDITRERLMLYEAYSGNLGSTVRSEYLPRWTIPRPYTSPELLGSAPQVRALEGVLAHAERLQMRSNAQEWRVLVESDGLFAFPTSFYPGWQALVDGAAQGVEPLEGLGWLALRLPAGEHTVAFHFEPTPTRRTTGWISLAAALVSLAWLGWAAARRQGRRQACLAGGVLLMLLGVAAVGQILPPPQAIPGPLVQDFVWAPYLHHEPGGLRLGNAVVLTDYRFTSGELVPGGTCELQLDWSAAAEDVMLRGELVAISAHHSEPAPVWARSQAAAGAASMVLAVPGDLPPGMYVVRLSAVRGEEALSITNAQGVELGLVATLPLTASKATLPETEPSAPLASFGPADLEPVITLLQAELESVDAGIALVRLIWRSERQAPLNYYLSLRLLDSNGQRIADRDLEPLAGSWPTVLWRPGEVLSDQVLIPLPPDAVTPTQIEVVLYDRRTLASIGSVRVP
ncbi:MAG: hypothetical protein GXY52_06135 [Chloroflexi bacterium]|nr:hypothetical protein [Chloroflexota bacterium]